MSKLATAAGAIDGVDIIVLPGIGGSGEAHWQTLWQDADPRIRRFAPASWNQPELGDWCNALDREVERSDRPPVLVAHSLSCLMVAHWQARSTFPVAGAMLVAIPDPEGTAFPREAAGFRDPPAATFRFPSLIVMSGDDPYSDAAFVREQARRWGSGIVDVGACGHINADSGLGHWPHGRGLLTAFVAGLGRAG